MGNPPNIHPTGRPQGGWGGHLEDGVGVHLRYGFKGSSGASPRVTVHSTCALTAVAHTTLQAGRLLECCRYAR